MEAARPDDERERDVGDVRSTAGSDHRTIERRNLLIASIASQVRSSVASIVYSADLLDARAGGLQDDLLQAAVHDISAASHSLQLAVDGLLDYAKLGPTISVPVSLRELLNRIQGLLRSLHRDNAHRLRLVLSPDAEWVRGNPMVIEQELLDRLLSATEDVVGPCSLTISCSTDNTVESSTPEVLVSVNDGSRTAQLRLPRSDGPR